MVWVDWRRRLRGLRDHDGFERTVMICSSCLASFLLERGEHEGPACAW